MYHLYTETKEKLNLCVLLKADKLIKEASLLHDDPRIAALCNGNLIAKEAVYHKSCYRDFTRIVTANKPGTIEGYTDIVEYKLVTEIF